MSSRSTQHRRNKEERDEMLRSLGLPVAQRRSRSPVTNAPLRVPDDVDLAHNFVDDDGNDYDENVDYDEYDNDYDEYDDGGYSDPEDNLDPNPDDPADIRRKLASWHLEYRVSERAMNDLLSWLKEYHFPHLPKTVKSLKTEARLAAVPIQRMERGQICHFGVKKMIMQILNKNDDNPLPNNCGHLQFGIDGVPIAKSSGSAFWPILIKLKEYADVLPVAVYHGSGKPPDVHEYMSEFVVELDSVLKNPIPWKNSEIRFELSGFIMDAPAKSYVLDIKESEIIMAPPNKKLKYDPAPELVEEEESPSIQQLVAIQQKTLEIALGNQQLLRKLIKVANSLRTDVMELKQARGIRNKSILPITGPSHLNHIEDHFHLFEEYLRKIFTDYAAGTGYDLCRHFCDPIFDNLERYNYSGRPAPNSNTPNKKPLKAASLKIITLLLSVVTFKYNVDFRSAKKNFIDAIKAYNDAVNARLLARAAAEAAAEAAAVAAAEDDAEEDTNE